MKKIIIVTFIALLGGYHFLLSSNSSKDIAGMVLSEVECLAQSETGGR